MFSLCDLAEDSFGIEEDTNKDYTWSPDEEVLDQGLEELEEEANDNRLLPKAIEQATLAQSQLLKVNFRIENTLNNEYRPISQGESQFARFQLSMAYRDLGMEEDTVFLGLEEQIPTEYQTEVGLEEIKDKLKKAGNVIVNIIIRLRNWIQAQMQKIIKLITNMDKLYDIAKNKINSLDSDNPKTESFKNKGIVKKLAYFVNNKTLVRGNILNYNPSQVVAICNTLVQKAKELVNDVTSNKEISSDKIASLKISGGVNIPGGYTFSPKVEGASKTYFSTNGFLIRAIYVGNGKTYPALSVGKPNPDNLGEDIKIPSKSELLKVLDKLSKLKDESKKLQDLAKSNDSDLKKLIESLKNYKEDIKNQEDKEVKSAMKENRKNAINTINNIGVAINLASLDMVILFRSLYKYVKLCVVNYNGEAKKEKKEENKEE